MGEAVADASIGSVWTREFVARQITKIAEATLERALASLGYECVRGSFHLTLAEQAPQLDGMRGLRLAEEPAALLLERLGEAVKSYGYEVREAELEKPKTGIFNGLAITLDQSQPAYLKVFILLHLFGHSVQWTAPAIEHKLEALQNTPDKAEFMQVLHNYEYEAAQFAAKLLVDAGFPEYQGWLADFVETDWQYVKRYYETDRIPPLEDCVSLGQPLIEPGEIPEIQLRKVAVRFAF